MRGVRAPFLLRRMASSWLLLASLMLTVLITSALLAALASFDARVLPQAAQHQLHSGPQPAIDVSGSVDAAIAAADMPAVSSALRTAFGPVPFQLASALWSDPLGLRGAAGRGGTAGRSSPVVRLVQAAAPGQIRTHATLTAGRWPGPPQPGQPIAVALPSAVATQLRLAPGDVLAVRDRDTGARLRFRVSGVFTLRDLASAYWGLDLVGTSGVSSQPGFTTYGPLVVSAAAFGRGGLAVGQASWVAQPDVARISAGQLALAARINRASSYLQSPDRFGGLQVTTGIPALLDGLSRRLSVARSLLAISALQLLLLAAAALALAARLLTGHREEENALLSSRGAARWQLARITVAETLLLATVAAAAGALAGGALAGLLVRAGSLRNARISLVGVPASGWLAAGLVLVLCLAITVWPALRPGTPGSVRVRQGRQAAVAGIARSGGDIALVVLALIAVRELRVYSAVAHLPAGGLGIDPVLAAAPALALAAISVILLRLLPVTARGMERLVVRTRHLGAALASWEITRRAVRQSGPVLLAVLAVATGTLALAQYQSWRQSARDQAAFSVGADVRVDTAVPVTVSQAGAISRVPGVTAAMPVSQVPAGSAGSVLAIDAPRAASTVLLRPDLASLPAAALWRLITPAAPGAGAPAASGAGAALPGRPARLQIVASVAAAPGTAPLGQLSATAEIQDAGGIVYTVPAGTMAADGRPQALIAELSRTRQASYPLRLLSLSLTYKLPPYPDSARAALAARQPDTVTISGLAVAPSATAAFGAPFTTGDVMRRWLVSASADMSGLPAQVSGQEPALTKWFRTPRGAQRGSFRPGSGPNPLALAKFGRGFPVNGLAGVLTMTAKAPARIIAGIATSAFLAANQARPGAVIQVAMLGSEVPVRIVGVISAFPTVTGGALIVDQGALQDYLASQGAAPLPVTQWWLRTARGAVPGPLPAGSAVTDRARVQAALLGNSLSAAPLLEGLAIAAAAAVLAAVGFSMGVAASVRSRRSQTALLAALGYTRWAQARGLCLEELMLTVPAALAGLAAGTGLAHLLVPAITLTASASAPMPPVLVKTPIGWVLLLTLAVAATPVAVAAAAVLRRPDPAAQLRAAEAI